MSSLRSSSLRAAASSACLALGACAAPQHGRYAHPTDPFASRLTQVDFGFGLRSYDDGRWFPNEDALALTFDFQEHAHIGPLMLEGGLHFARDRERVGTASGSETFSSETLELSIGVRHLFEIEGALASPYFGAGGSFVFVDVETSDGTISEGDDAHAGGGYAKAGLLFPLGNNAHMSLEVRRIETSAFDFGEFTLDGDALQLLVVFGTRWF